MANGKKPIITLVGFKQAKKGFSFLNERPPKECKNCALFKVCISKLKVGRVYTVTGIRDKLFPCGIHEEGVRVVEVIETNIETNIEKRTAFLNGLITFSPRECKEVLCPHFEKCFPQGLKIGDKCRVIMIKEQVDCQLNHHLVLSVLQRVD